MQMPTPTTTDGTTKVGVVSRFWAQQKVAGLSVHPKQNRVLLLGLGQRFKLVTPHTSLLVLETAEQYIEHKIEPPHTRRGFHDAYCARCVGCPSHYCKQQTQQSGQEKAGQGDAERHARETREHHLTMSIGKQLLQPVSGSGSGAGLLEGLLAWSGNVSGHGAAADIPNYDRVFADGHFVEEESRVRNLQDTYTNWQQKVKWWEANHTVPVDAGEDSAGYDGRGRARGATMHRMRSRQRSLEAEEEEEPMMMMAAVMDEPMAAYAAPRMAVAMAAMAPAMEEDSEFADAAADESSEEAVLGASHESGARNAAGGLEIKSDITLSSWDPETPYMLVLKGAKKRGTAAVYTSYLDHLEAHGKTPGFFLDVATFLYSIGDAKHGHRVLSSILDLSLSNPTIQRVVAYRFLEVGDYDLSIMVFKDLLEMRPEEPQSYRNLALALSRRAEQETARFTKPCTVHAAKDLRQAIELLHHVASHEWNHRFPHITSLVLVELNRLLAFAQTAHLVELKMQSLHPAVDDADKKQRPSATQAAEVNPLRLWTKPLDFGLRVVLDWDTDMTDIDLWVTDPRGEKTFYSHTRSDIGGCITDDFTQGLGTNALGVAVHDLAPVCGFSYFHARVCVCVCVFWRKRRVWVGGVCRTTFLGLRTLHGFTSHDQVYQNVRLTNLV